MQEPRIWNYCDYSSDNYGSSRAVDIGDITLYFSYKTVVAFNTPETGLVISENCWSTTTGRHLNAIDSDHSRRIDHEPFERLLNDMLSKYTIQKA